MEVSFQQFKDVAKTLPIGYYLGNGIEVEVSDKVEVPFFDPFHQKICLSYKNLARVFEHITDTDNLEMYIRSDLYHEISHVLLTPKYLMDVARRRPILKDVINIFEDERIETLCQDFFLNVDFKTSIIHINGFHGQDAQSLMEDFFFICRFRHGKKQYVDKVADLINKYGYDDNGNWNITADSQNYYEYQKAIIDFFEEVAKDWLEENEHEKLTNKNGEYDSLSQYEQQSIVNQVVDEMFNNGESGDGYVMVQDLEIHEDGSMSMTVDGNPIEISAEEVKEAVAQAETEQSNKNPHQHLTSSESNKLKTKVQKMLSTKANNFIDNDLTDKLDKILRDFVSRVKNNSSAAARYSGVLNPRSIGREDWRIWDYKSQQGPIKGYDKLHLNLYIDTSGSFRSNEHKVNVILKSLDILEKKYNFFYFDLVTCQVGETLRTKDERYIQTGGGNDIDDNIWDIHKKLSDTKSFNIDIVLFDGDAFTDCRGSKSSHVKNFGAWNSTHATIISDDDNESYIKQYAPQAHHLFVNSSRQSKSYADMLFDNITTALHLALI